MKKEWFYLILIFIIFAGLFLVNRFSEDPNQENQELSGEELYLKEQVWQQRINASFSQVECHKSTSVPTFGGNLYAGPLIDSHWHIANIPDSEPSSKPDRADGDRPLLGVNTKITDIICALENENTSKVFAFFPVYKEIQEPMVEVVKRTMEMYPDKFVPFIMPPDNDDSPDGFPTVDAQTLGSMLQIEPGLFKGYGEIGLYARGDHGGPTGSKALPPNSQRLKDIYSIVKENNLVIYFHLGEGQKEAFEEVLEQNPEINFIWHGDQLIPYENGIQNLQNIDDILTNHPNAYYEVDELYGDDFILRPEVSKSEFLAHFQDYEPLLEEDVSTWKDFIERHPDQVIWGTDRGWSSTWSADEDVGITLTNYARAFIARLDPAVQEKYAHKNSEKLLAGND